MIECSVNFYWTCVVWFGEKVWRRRTFVALIAISKNAMLPKFCRAFISKKKIRLLQ